MGNIIENQYITNMATAMDVSPAIHSKDFVYHFVIKHPIFNTDYDAINFYFHDGHISVTKLLELLKEVCGYDDRPVSLLEFASGYGCVTRHLIKEKEKVKVTACDIHQAAVEFLRSYISVEAILSFYNPDDLIINDNYDVVFALSFFSHVPKKTFKCWVEKLFSFVKSDGFLIFTTHGLASTKIFNDYDCQLDSEGFWFNPSYEHDLDTDEYGITVATPQYVLGCLQELRMASLKYFRGGDWWDHQDTYVIHKLSE